MSNTPFIIPMNNSVYVSSNANRRLNRYTLMNSSTIINAVSAAILLVHKDFIVIPPTLKIIYSFVLYHNPITNH